MARFERYKQSKVLRDLAKKHPDKIEEYFTEEENGHFIYLQPGWCFEDTHGITGQTVKEVLEDFRNIESCDCDDCK